MLDTESKEYTFTRGNYQFDLVNIESIKQVTVTDNRTGNTANISKIEVEIVGIKKQDKWLVTLVTPNSIKKLIYQTTDKLDVIAFEFDKFEDAIFIQNLLALYLLRI